MLIFHEVMLDFDEGCSCSAFLHTEQKELISQLSNPG